MRSDNQPLLCQLTADRFVCYEADPTARESGPFDRSDKPGVLGMALSLTHHILAQVENAAQLYYRLVLVVWPPRTDKASAFRHLEVEQGWPRINISLALSERLLELTTRQRALRVARILDDLVCARAANVTLLDNIELLFHPDLQQHPLQLLQGLSRNRTIVASWPGSFDGHALVYATSGHPEHRRYEAPQALIVSEHASFSFAPTTHQSVIEPTT